MDPNSSTEHERSACQGQPRHGPPESAAPQAPAAQDRDLFREALLANCYFHFEFDVTAGGLIWGDFEARDGTHPIRDATGMVDPVPFYLWVDRWNELYRPQFDQLSNGSIFSNDFFRRSFQRNERILDVEVKQHRPGSGEMEYMHIYVILYQEPADQHIWACIIWRDISRSRSRGFESNLRLQSTNEELKRTVSREQQFQRSVLSGALMVYNINLSRDQIEDEFYEIVDGTSYPMLELVGLTAPCSFDEFCRRWSQVKVSQESRETFLRLYNRQYLLDAYARGQYQLEIEFETAIGRGIPVILRNTILLTRDPATEEILAMVNGKDVTAQRREELEKRRALQSAYDAANRANAAKSDFLARMSHDLRTPMNAILGMSAIASSHLNDPQRVADCLNKITSSSKRLLDLINEVLDMSKLESGTIDLQEEAFVLSDLVEELLEICQPQLADRGHRLDVILRDIVHQKVIGDSRHLLQAFMSLMSNAIKYTPNGGTIALSIAEKPTNRPQVGCYEFIIQDNGIGMSEDFLQILFTPFERADDERVRKEPGTGLGLAIAKNVIQMMNGTIEVTSRLDRGSRFTVTLFLRLQDEEVAPPAPCPSEPQQAPAPLEGLEGTDLSGRRALLAEDNPLNAEIAKEILAMAGIEVDWVENGSLAVEAMSNAPDGYYDIVFMDLQMPVMNGYDATRAIRAMGREYTGTVPILALSANSFAQDVHEAQAAGMNEHIAKPLDFDQLKAALLKWLQ